MRNVFLEGLSSLIQRQTLGAQFWATQVKDCLRFPLLSWMPKWTLFYLDLRESFRILCRCWGFWKSGLLFEMFSLSEREFYTLALCMHIHTEQKWRKNSQAAKPAENLPVAKSRRNYAKKWFLSQGVIQQVPTRRLCQSPFTHLFCSNQPYGWASK